MALGGLTAAAPRRGPAKPDPAPPAYDAAKVEDWLDPSRFPPQPRINELHRSPQRLYLDLNGEWLATIAKLDDPSKAPDSAFDLRLQVPGCLEGQGLGMDIPPLTVNEPPFHGNIYGMQHGQKPGWPTFRRRFSIPAEWAGKRIILGLGGVTGSSKVWLDMKPVPELNNPISAVGIQADLTERLTPGEHTLTVFGGPRKAGEAYVVGDIGIPNAGMQMISRLWRFRGLWRGVEPVAVDPLHLLDFHIVGNLEAKTFRVKCRLSQPAPGGCSLSLRAKSSDGKRLLGEIKADVAAGGRTAEGTVAVPELGPWSHRNPELAVIEVAIARDGATVDTLIERTGLRSLALRNPTEDKADGILLNGIPTFFAGEMHTCRSPDTISPFIDRAALRKRFQAFKDAGFRYLRMHTTVAHPEMLDTCDELGLYLQTETITIRHGGEHMKGGGWKDGDDPLRNLGVCVWRDTLLRDRNHPSLISVSMTNEGSGRQEKNGNLLLKKYEYCARMAYGLDGTRFYVDSTPGYVLYPRETVGPHFPIEHEPGRWASYPDPALLAAHPDLKDTWHIAWVGARLEKAGLASWWPRFAASSQKLQARYVAAQYQARRSRNPNYCGGEHSTTSRRKCRRVGLLRGSSVMVRGCAASRGVARHRAEGADHSGIHWGGLKASPPS
jgi:hypothetical protein